MPKVSFISLDPKTKKKTDNKVKVSLEELMEKHGLAVLNAGHYVVREEIVRHIGEKDDIVRVVKDLGYSVYFHEKYRPSILSRLKTRFQNRNFYLTPPLKNGSMEGAGITHRGHKFTTHSTRSHQSTALTTFAPWQVVFAFLLISGAVVGIAVNPIATGIVVVGLLSALYFSDVVFSFFLVLKSLHIPPELSFSTEELEALKAEKLPIYTVLCPLYKEAHVLPHFIDSIKVMDWPKNKLDVQLLLEEDDTHTIKIARAMDLPKFVRIVVVPDSKPKTKPKACNFGLANTRGEYVVVYDAEDRPDPLQLKKAYLAFQKSKPNVACVQAKLNYYNPNQNLLTRLFTAEYSLWFDVVLPGLQSINTTIPLGGTSNHFKTHILKKLEGWDAFNVTEDCDLGSHLFKNGYSTVLIDSTTEEEANSRLGNWIRQRSRWIKGYMQTYLVHTKNFPEFIRTHKWHAFIFQLVIGLRMTFMIINPFLWIATISYFALHSLVGSAIEAFYPAPVFYIAVISLVFGNFLYLYYYMIGCAKRGAWSLVKWVFLIPFYWLAISFAAWKAFYQLLTKPHYWEKTTHGLHLSQAKKSTPMSHITAGTLLILANGIGNVFYILYNTYLGRSLTSAEYGIIGLFGSLLFIANIPISTIGATLTYRIGYLSGKAGGAAKDVWKYFRSIGISLSIGFTVVWLIATPYLSNYFHIPDTFIFLLFTPVWGLGLLSSIDRSFLTANMNFFVISIAIMAEAGLKLGLAYFFVNVGLSQYVYAALPLSMIPPFIFTWLASHRKQDQKELTDSEIRYFPKKYFATSILSNLSSIAFLSLDVIMVKRLLDPQSAGLYALISLIGKMVFFGGSLFSQFITPVVSRKEGAGVSSKQDFYKLLFATTVIALGSFIFIAIFGKTFLPIVFGSQIDPIINLVPFYCLGMGFYVIATSIINFHQVKRQYLVPLASFPFSIFLILGMHVFGYSLSSTVMFVTVLSLIHLVVIVLLHIFYDSVDAIFHHLQDFFDLFSTLSLFKKSSKSVNKLKILIFNWYDIKHVWAGGAEAYIHQIAKNWVKEGHNVTMFTGNDWQNPRYEEIDGISVVRRGGQFTVAIWAFIYYVFKFRGKFDVIIDIPKGVPFFAPVYAGVPVICLIHQVHQEMFRTELQFPLKQTSLFLEGVLMPVLYRRTPIVAVSKSTQEAIKKLHIGKSGIEIVNPGVEIVATKTKKTKHPQLIYLGRLRSYKSIDLLLMAAANLKVKFPNLKVIIAGTGEDEARLKAISEELSLGDTVSFLGKVTEEEKSKLFSESWIAVQPSIVEGWGITNIEANLCGTPVVAADSDGLRDSVLDGETGLLFPAGDLVKLEYQLETLLSSKSTREAMQKKAHVWSQNFGWAISSNQFMGFVKSHLQDKHNLSVIPSFLKA